MITLHILTPGVTPVLGADGRWSYRRNVAVFGEFIPLTLPDLRKYVRQFPMAWVEV